MADFCSRLDRALAPVAPNKPFLVSEKATLTHGEVSDRVRRLFSHYASLGLVPGDRIGILGRQAGDISVLLVSAIRYGLGTVVLNADLTEQELARAVSACGLAHVFVQDVADQPYRLPDSVKTTVFAPMTAARGKGGLLGRLRRKQAETGPLTLKALLEDTAPADMPSTPAEDALALMLYTSGTTSQPKVVQLTQGNLAAQFDIFDQVYGYGPDHRILNPLPMHFTDGICHGPLAAFVYGATLFRPEQFDVSQLEDLLNQVYRDAITHLIVVPAILALMDRMGSDFQDTFDGPDFQYIRSSGDRLPMALWQSIESRFNVRVVNTYGMSETVCEATFSGPADGLRKVGSVGKAVGCEWRIVTAQGTPTQVGETGELQIRGAIITAGYRNQPELTADTIIDGWLKTGDLATCDADGFLTIVGRHKDLIISGGVNIHPQEVTDCLLSCPGVADAIAFGMPHGVWGEQVAAAVVRADGFDGSGGAELDRVAVIQHCNGHLAQQKVPRVILFVDALPRNAAGKVLVKDLQSQSQSLDVSAGSAQETDIAKIVLSQAAEVFGVAEDTLTLSSVSASTQGWDSFAHLTLITALEARFGLELSAQEVLRINSLSNLVDVILSKTS